MVLFGFVFFKKIVDNNRQSVIIILEGDAQPKNERVNSRGIVFCPCYFLGGNIERTEIKQAENI